MSKRQLLLFFLFLPIWFLSVGMGSRPDPGSGTSEPYNPEEIINNQQEIDLANNYFGNKIIIKQPIYALRAAGAIAWTDDGGKTVQYTQLLPDEEYPEPELQNETVFESIVDKKFATQVSYLAFVSGSMSIEDKAAVLLQKIFRAKGPAFFSIKVQEKLPIAIEALKKEGRKLYYIEAIQFINANHSVLKKNDSSLEGAFFVNIGGEMHVSSSRVSNKDFVAVEYIELNQEGKSIKSKRVDPILKNDGEIRFFENFIEVK